MGRARPCEPVPPAHRPRPATPVGPGVTGHPEPARAPSAASRTSDMSTRDEESGGGIAGAKGSVSRDGAAPPGPPARRTSGGRTPCRGHASDLAGRRGQRRAAAAARWRSTTWLPRHERRGLDRCDDRTPSRRCGAFWVRAVRLAPHEGRDHRRSGVEAPVPTVREHSVTGRTRASDAEEAPMRGRQVRALQGGSTWNGTRAWCPMFPVERPPWTVERAVCAADAVAASAPLASAP